MKKHKYIIEKIDIKLSPRQKKMADLYFIAHKKLVIWVKDGNPRVLDPSEVFIFF